MTIFPFAPSTAAPFQFQPVLDGTTYNAVVTWSLFGQRYYINLYDLDQNLIFCLPVIGSPDGLQLQTLAWLQGVVAATVQAPHGLPIGATVALTVAGCTPDAYNGLFSALVTSPTTFSYQLTNDPGLNTVAGTVSKNINLAGGYFGTSTLVFRNSSQQFEVNP